MERKSLARNAVISLIVIMVVGVLAVKLYINLTATDYLNSMTTDHLPISKFSTPLTIA